MTVRFLDGPAEGVSLGLRRAPMFLRVVVSPAGKVDALDQLGDVPMPREAVHVYQGVEGKLFTFRGDVFVCVRGPGGSQQAGTAAGEYRHRPDVDGELLRDTAAWREWCRAQPEAARLEDPGEPARTSPVPG